MKRWLWCGGVLVLCACAGTGAGSGAQGVSEQGPVAMHTPDKITEAATAPLDDMNLLQNQIPTVLLEAKKAPYAMPADAACNKLVGLIHELDVVLGPDVDAPVVASESGAAEAGAAFVEDAAANAVRSAVGGIIPFRSWFRKLSGADKRSRDVASAVSSGTLRRAYLKGVAQSRSCVMLAPAIGTVKPVTPSAPIRESAPAGF